MMMVLLVGLFAGQASANNIAVANVVFKDLDTSAGNAGGIGVILHNKLKVQ